MSNSYNELKELIPNHLKLEHIPEELIDIELCITAVTKDGLALEFVPNHLKTKDLCDIAISKCGIALGVSEELKTEYLCKLDILKKECEIELVPI